MKLIIKALALLAAFASPAHSQIYADFKTSLGDFTAELYYADSPKTVANFIGLAQGSKTWVDSSTNEVKQGVPYYDGILFHRVISGFMNQTGSQKGDGSDGPGYVIPDETSNGLLHDQAYILSSANSGPHTNGSQFFTTVGATPWLDGIHTVFGKVTTGTAVIDTINGVPTTNSKPDTDVVINEVTIRRVGAAAVAFDETAQNIAVVSPLLLCMSPVSSGQPSLDFTQTAGSSFSVGVSPDLQTWSLLDRYLDASQVAETSFSSQNNLDKEFYRNGAIVTWPNDATFPSTLDGRIINMTTNVGDFILDCTSAQTLTYNGTSYPITDKQVNSDGYGTSILLFTNGLVPFNFRLGADLPVGVMPSGSLTGTAYTSPTTAMSGTFSFAN